MACIQREKRDQRKLKIAITLIFSYLFGSIPFGWILSRLVRMVDIRRLGSGRTGTTNTIRASEYPITIHTLLVNIVKLCECKIGKMDFTLRL